MDDLFEFLRQAGDKPLSYEHHPPLRVLKRYVRGQLREGLPPPEPERISQLMAGDLAEEDWTNFAVATHVRTCTTCAQQVSGLRRLGSRLPSFARDVPSLMRRFSPTIYVPRWAWTIPLVLVIGLGVGIVIVEFLKPSGPAPQAVSLITPAQPITDTARIEKELKRLAQSPPFEEGTRTQTFEQPKRPEVARGQLDVQLDMTALLWISQRLQAAGLDLTHLNLEELEEYQVPSGGQSLQEVAQHLYGNEQLWIILYLLNRESLRELLQQEEKPGTVPLPEGLSLRYPKLK